MRDTVALTLVLLACAAAILAPFAVYPVLLMKVLCFALFASAFNLLAGFTGLMSFGHAAFLGTGAYAASYLIKEWGATPEVALLFAAGCAALLGLAMGALAIRRQGRLSSRW